MSCGGNCAGYSIWGAVKVNAMYTGMSDAQVPMFELPNYAAKSKYEPNTVDRPAQVYGLDKSYLDKTDSTPLKSAYNPKVIYRGAPINLPNIPAVKREQKSPVQIMITPINEDYIARDDELPIETARSNLELEIAHELARLSNGQKSVLSSERIG